MIRASAWTAALAACCLSAPASAAVVARTIGFTAVGPFTGANNTTPPVNSVTGSFTLSYDPDAAGSQGDVTVNSLSIPYAGTARYYVYGGGVVAIGSTNYLNGTTGIYASPGVDGFAATFYDLSATNGASAGTFNYSRVGYQDYASTRTVLVTSLVGGVPEPSTWSLMLLGFAAVGLSIRRNRTAASSGPAALAAVATAQG